MSYPPTLRVIPPRPPPLSLRIVFPRSQLPPDLVSEVENGKTTILDTYTFYSIQDLLNVPMNKTVFDFIFTYCVIKYVSLMNGSELLEAYLNNKTHPLIKEIIELEGSLELPTTIQRPNLQIIPLFSVIQANIYVYLYRLISRILLTTNDPTIRGIINIATYLYYRQPQSQEDFDQIINNQRLHPINIYDVITKIKNEVYIYIMNKITPGVYDTNLLKIAKHLGYEVQTQVESIMKQPLQSSIVTPIVNLQNPIPSTMGLTDGTEYVLANWIVEKFGSDVVVIKTVSIEPGDTVFSNRDKSELKRAARAQGLAVIPYTLIEHANMLIVNFKLNTVEHFEPHGYKYTPDDKTLRNRDVRARARSITENIGEITGKSMTYRKPEYLCPRGIGGPQSREVAYSEGQCTIWGLYLIALVVLNKSTPTEELVRYMIERPDMLRELTKFRCALMSDLRTIDLRDYDQGIREDVRETLDDEKEYINRCNRT